MLYFIFTIIAQLDFNSQLHYKIPLLLHETIFNKKENYEKNYTLNIDEYSTFCHK
ncbi:MAG: Unknown protein [uncultured Sulfurovum sp.]|uniref:Uncharacterized protein n=1 Tax=uncultured Sulfurovum sp. TaxID=269237 RepID=A0A6S6RZ03_9BACT|nr:MAG: Unknown protein [uncultured Sulfurovum sp.]